MTKIPKMTLTDSPDDPAIETISKLLSEFNESSSGRANDYRPLTIVLSDPDTQETVGGLVGWTSFSYLHVNLLYLPDALRSAGLGSQMMALAEEEALRRGCHGVWLDTFSFQARGFYERLGYSLFGAIDEHPPGHSRYFLKKDLRPQR
ncbi:MAG: GNAT family N-acetyltransferase [Acidobacteriaceae bacterium]|jgi:GNAT superfamily N-acetyltransferase